MKIDIGGIKEGKMHKILTLLYHRVIELEYDKNQLAVSPDNFYDQMLYLKNNYPIVRFEQNWNKLHEDSICITFDDGYMDNFTNAYPILQELNIPFTVFITTGNLNTSEEYWWDELERLLLDRKRNYKNTFELRDEMFSCQWSTQSWDEREELYDTLHWLMYDKISVSKRNDWIRQLQEWSDCGKVGREQNQGLQLDEIQLNLSLLSIGAHTVNHPSLKNLSEQEQYYEISQSIKSLEDLLKQKVQIFSYPFGGENDFSEATIEICKKLKICKAAANIPGLWESKCDDYQVPRNIVRNWDIDEYKNRICNFWKYKI